MNELIKKLAEQSGAGRRAGVGGLVFRDNELEKFAELIVLETLRVTGATISQHQTAIRCFGVK